VSVYPFQHLEYLILRKRINQPKDEYLSIFSCTGS
jgi:hypothetical protein